MVQYGPASTLVKSSTLTPLKGPDWALTLSTSGIAILFLLWLAA
jgi:hypothetical protein